MKRSLLVAVALLTACCVAVGFAPPEQAVRTIMNCFGNRIKNVGAPIDGTDAVNRNHSSNASNLTSGTVPDARFPSALPAVDGSALTAIQRSYSATSSSLANGDSLTVTHAADANFYRTPLLIGDAFAGDSTVLLLNCNGTNGSTAFTDSSLYGRTVTANGNAQITTTNPKFGSGAGLFDGSGDYLTFSGSISDFAFGSGAFTIEFWANFSSVSGTRCLVDFRPAGGNGAYILIYTTNGSLRVYVNTADVITGSTLSTGAYHHIALCKSGTSLRLFVNGTQVGSTYTDNVTYLQGTNRPMIGANGSGGGNESVDGRFDGIRISRSALYTSNFTPPASELTAPAVTGVLPIVASGQTGITVRYDNGAGANSSTTTTFTNNTGAPIRNATARVSLINTLAP